VKRTTLAALVAAVALVPLAGVAGAAPQGHTRDNAPAATFEGDNTPAGFDDVRPSFYNGQAATVDEFPGIVAGIRSGGTRPEGQTCTGTVVAPRKIVIAAHCADAAGEKSFVYGLDDLADFDGGNGDGLQARVVEYKKHPSYVNFDQGYDVAVVTVDRDLRLKGGAAYPAVATSADAGLEAPGRNGTGFGYGKKTHDDVPGDVTLDKATLPIVNGSQVCNGVGAGFKAATMICAGYADGRTTILPGDSGGPLVVDGRIIGLASWSRSDFRWYSVYARLTNDMGDWVRRQVGDPQPPAEFGVSVEPANGSVAAGRSLSVTARTTEGPDGPASVKLGATGLPAGVTAVFQPESVTTGGTSKLTFDAAANAANGTYRVTVSASGTTTATTAFTLTVTGGGDPEPGDFTLGATPSSVTVAAGRNAATTITSAGGPATVALTASGVPDGVRAVFQPSSITTGSNAKLTFDAAANAVAGTYPVTVTGTAAGGTAATTTVTLTVTGGEPPVGDVRVTASPASGSTWQGGFVQTQVSAAGGTGGLTLSATGLPSGARVQFDPATIGQGGTSNAYVFTGFSTPVGTYPITVRATSADGKSGTVTFTLTVTRLG
jgi:secreted trypsin-like serine protease